MEKTFLVIAALMLVPLATASALAQTAEGETPYSAEDASHAFGTMDLFAVVDADYYLVIDEAEAAGHEEVTELDLAIALDFATYQNAIVDAIKDGPENIVGDLDLANPELAETIRSLENSRFSAVFDSDLFEDELVKEMPYGNIGAVLITVYYLLHIF